MPTDADTHRGHKYFITADIVVLAAGTLGSTEILLRSQAEGLARLRLARQPLHLNGDAIALAYNNDVPVNGIGVGQPPKAQVPPVGQAVNALIDLRDAKDVRDGIAMCECALPSAFASALPALLAPGGAVFGEHETRSLGDQLEAMERATDSLIKGAYQGAVHNTQTFLAVGHDAGNGLMRLDDDRLAIEWTNGPQQRVFQRIEEALKTAAHATGGTYMRNPVSEKMLGGNLMTVHPLGGCTMGESSARRRRQPQGAGFRCKSGCRAGCGPRRPLRVRRRGDPVPVRHPSTVDHHGAGRACDDPARARSGLAHQRGRGAGCRRRRLRRRPAAQPDKARERNLAWFARWRRRSPAPVEGE